MPDAKRSKLHEMLLQLVSPGKRVERKLIEQCVGLLLWYCGGAYWLKPWLSELYKLLYKPALVFRSLSATHFGAMVASLMDGLRVGTTLPSCDVQKGQGMELSRGRQQRPADPNPKNPQRGCGLCIFLNFDSSWTKTCRSTSWAARFFLNTVRAQVASSRYSHACPGRSRLQFCSRCICAGHFCRHWRLVD